MFFGFFFPLSKRGNWISRKNVMVYGGCSWIGMFLGLDKNTLLFQSFSVFSFFSPSLKRGKFFFSFFFFRI